MINLSKIPLFWCISSFALVVAACSASGGEETIGSVFSNNDDASVSSSSSIAESEGLTSSATSSTSSANGSSTDQSSGSDSQDNNSQSSSGGSIKPTVTCPSTHPVLDWSDECHSCDDETGFIPDDDESCERLCDGKNGTTKRIKNSSYCVLEKCPDNKPLMDSWGWGDCRSCKYDGPVRDTINCSKCSNRKIQDGYCVIANCEGRPLLDDNGFCYPCSTSLSVQTVKGECKSKCPSRRESGTWSWGDGADKIEGTWCDYDSEGSE